MIKFGVVGLGNIGKRHKKYIEENNQCSFVGAFDINEELSDYNSFEDLLNSEAEVLCICSPNYLHKEHTIKALKSGKHVLCEKPMAISTADCEQMLDVSIQTGKKLFVVKQNRYNEPVYKVKQLLDSNKLGKVYQVAINCFWNRNRNYYNSSWRGEKKYDGGCLFTQFSHFVDIMYYLFGDVTPVKGIIENYNHPYISFEDTGSFILKTIDSNALINFNFSTNTFSKNMEGSITIIAEKGTVKIGGQYLNVIEYQDFDGEILITENKTCNDYGLYKGSMSNHDKVIQNVVNTLLGKDQMKTNAQEGMKVVEIIEKMYNSCE